MAFSSAAFSIFSCIYYDDSFETLFPVGEDTYYQIVATGKNLEEATIIFSRFDVHFE